MRKDLFNASVPFLVCYAVVLLMAMESGGEIAFIFWFTGGVLTAFHQMLYGVPTVTAAYSGLFLSWSYFWYYIEN